MPFPKFFSVSTSKYSSQGAGTRAYLISGVMHTARIDLLAHHVCHLLRLTVDVAVIFQANL